MGINACRQERFSSRTVGLFFLVASLLLFVVGLVMLPIVGFIFAIPFMLLGVVMLAAPESSACRLIRNGLKMGSPEKVEASVQTPPPNAAYSRT